MSYASQVTWVECKRIWPTSPRDFVILSFVLRGPEPESFYLIRSSVQHNNVTPKQTHVRAKLIFSGLSVRPHLTKAEHSAVTYIVHTSVEGNVPGSWVQAMANPAGMLKNAISFCQQINDFDRFLGTTKRAHVECVVN